MDATATVMVWASLVTVILIAPIIGTSTEKEKGWPGLRSGRGTVDRIVAHVGVEFVAERLCFAVDPLHFFLDQDAELSLLEINHSEKKNGGVRRQLADFHAEDPEEVKNYFHAVSTRRDSPRA